MLIRRSTTHRPGISLMEVLVGFGILAIGVTSVMTLFPFSAITLGGALRDDRTTTCAITADGYLRNYYKLNVVEVGGGSEPFFQKLDCPVSPPTTQFPTASPNQPSYPVALDPMGYTARIGRGDQTFLGDSLSSPTLTFVSRVPLSITNPNIPSPNTPSTALSLRLCSQMDLLTYDGDGNVPFSADMREMRYNWMWVLQRPVESDTFTVRMQVVVFDRRVHLYAPPQAEQVVTGVTFIPGETAITNVPSSLALRKGSWVMDATVNNANVDTDGVTRPLRHGEFYRVLSVTDLGNGTSAVEVHKPVVRADGLVNLAATSKFQYSGTLVSMPAVADVFERPVLTSSTGP